MLKRLFEIRPNSSVVLADFDYLPPPDIISTASQRRITKRADGEPLGKLHLVLLMKSIHAATNKETFSKQ